MRNLSYRDGTLQPTLELRRQLTRLIREIRPDLVITLDPTTVFASDHGYINHPDHRAAGEAAIYATFPSAGARPIFRELLDEGYEPHDVSKVYMTLTNHPMLYIDVTETYEQKQAALRCHASQLNEDVIGMIAKWDSEAGKKIGCRFAESFRVIDLTRDNQA